MPAPCQFYPYPGRAAARGRLRAHSPHYSPLLSYTIARCDLISGFDHEFVSYLGFHHRPYSGGGAPHQHLDHTMSQG